jgi:hypothetical protein
MGDGCRIESGITFFKTGFRERSSFTLTSILSLHGRGRLMKGITRGKGLFTLTLALSPQGRGRSW